MIKRKALSVSALVVFFSLAHAFTLDESRRHLSQAFSSPSGKLTLSPELVIPEPTDMTAILLQSSAIQTVSARIRAAKANAVFLQGSIHALQTFATEQEGARGGFPSPVPIIYCTNNNPNTLYDDENDDGDSNLQDIADAGAHGLLVRIGNGEECSSIEDIGDDTTFWSNIKAALACGLQPIPEITIGGEVASSWQEKDVCLLMERLSDGMGSDPVAVVLTVNQLNDETVEPVALPSIPYDVSKRIPILGSVRVSGGEGRLGLETTRIKDAGYAGAFLRSDCVPGFRMNPDLNIVSQFWAACINDLKSTRSKSFSFRSKNNMEKSLSTQWANLQNSVISSGALGDPNEQVSIRGDDDSGDYQGF
jgi:hypothetical protein